MSQQYVTVEEAATCLKVSERAIRRYIAAGKLAACLTRGPSGKEWRIRADSLTNFQTASSSPNRGSGHPPDRPADTSGHPVSEPADTSGHPPDRPGDLRTPADTCGHPPADTSGHPVSEPADTDTDSETRSPAPWTSPPHLDRRGLTLEEFLARLEHVHYSHGQYQASCPAHADRNPSLSIREGNDGRILLHCFAGCEPEAIVAALGLTLADLFPEPARRPDPTPTRRIVATYDYRDEAGNLLYQTVRYDPKDFRQRRPDGAGGWLWNLDGVQRVLYRLPELCQADPTDWVFVCEGEKDADRLAALGLTATTNPMGAGQWREEYAETLHGRRVGLLPDHDEPGRKHAEQVAASLTRHGAAEVKVLNLPGVPDKGDVSDWLADGHTAAELLDLAESAATWTPPAVPLAVIGGAAVTSDEPTQTNTLSDFAAWVNKKLGQRSGRETKRRVTVLVRNLLHTWDRRIGPRKSQATRELVGG